MYFPGIAEIAEMQRRARENARLIQQQMLAAEQMHREQQRKSAETEADVQDAEWRDIPALEAPK